MESNYKKRLTAEAVGYAFEQAYSSQIMIARMDDDKDTDEKHLQELRDLVHLYNDITQDVDGYTLLRWYIDINMRSKVLEAKTLDEVYND